VAGPERTRSGRHLNTSARPSRHSAAAIMVGTSACSLGPAAMVPEVVSEPPTCGLIGQGDHPPHRPSALERGEVCYDQELARKPTLAGRISVHSPSRPWDNDHVSHAEHEHGRRARRELCGQCRPTLEFPKPTGGGIAIVLYPFSSLPRKVSFSFLTAIHKRAGLPDTITSLQPTRRRCG